jgi:hypothetical protein
MSCTDAVLFIIRKLIPIALHILSRQYNVDILKAYVTDSTRVTAGHAIACGNYNTTVIILSRLLFAVFV